MSCQQDGYSDAGWSER
jgi:hypothetical protein